MMDNIEIQVTKGGPCLAVINIDEPAEAEAAT
jgi:hypothetical protein